MDSIQTQASFDNFRALDIRVGTVVEAKPLEEARKPAYQMKIDFGKDIGLRKTSAQITDLYQTEELVGSQILAVINFPPKQIGTFMSEALVLGIYSDAGVILLRPDRPSANGNKVG